jgi:Kef-type K+ transport system membrane component KefB
MLMNKRKLIGLIAVFFIGLIIGLASLINAFFSLSNFEMMILWIIISAVSFAIAIVCAYFGDFIDALRFP